jgi:hypothetical protein
LWFKASPGKKVCETHLNGKKLGLAMSTCHPRWEEESRIVVQVCLGRVGISKTLSSKQPEQKGLEIWLKW